VHERHDDEPEQARGQKTQPEEHDRFDHEKCLRPRRCEVLLSHCHAARPNSSAGGR
jgi:hypothetical protein